MTERNREDSYFIQVRQASIRLCIFKQSGESVIETITTLVDTGPPWFAKDVNVALGPINVARNVPIHLGTFKEDRLCPLLLNSLPGL